jgi:hypothetical protein
LREAGRILRGRFEDDSRWVRGAPGGGSAVRPGRRPRRWRGAGRGASAPGRDPGGILQGSWPEPSGTVRERFEDGSRWVRGAPGGGSAVRPGRRPRRWRRAVRGASAPGRDGGRILRGRFENDSRTVRGRPGGEARLDQAGDPGDGAEPGAGRARPVGTLAGSFREAGRNLQGRFEDDSRWVRGAPGGGSAVRPGRRPRRWRRAVRRGSATGGDGGRILSGTVRGGFEGVGAAEAPSDQAGGPGHGAEPCDERVRPVGDPGRRPGPRRPAGAWNQPVERIHG